MDAAILIRIAVAGVGLWYIVTLIRRRRRVQQIPSRIPRGSDELSSQRWEGIRQKSLVSALALILPMGVSAVLRGPIWLTTALLIGVAVCAGLYLVASFVAGWFEGKGSLPR